MGLSAEFSVAGNGVVSSNFHYYAAVIPGRKAEASNGEQDGTVVM